MLKRLAIGCFAITIGIAAIVAFSPHVEGQPPQPPGGKGGQPPGGRGGPGGPGGKGGPGGQQIKLVKQFDKNGDGWLDKEERDAARTFLKTNPRGGRGGPKGGFGGRGGGEAPKPGPKVDVADAKTYPAAVAFYDGSVLRTLFLEFENKDWEDEMAEFYRTDVDVPATLIVDGKRYPNVGVRFRGASSYFGVGPGLKHSLNIRVDMANADQRIYGFKTLNLLNSHDDPSFMSTVLYSQIGRQYTPVPKANHVKLVINGESWGVYVNTQQFDKVFLEENYKTSKGTRWKVQGSPGGDGGLSYVGDNVEEYKRRYTMKSGDDAKAWQDLINLCRVLNQTPLDKLEEALKPILDIDNVLWFLALDVVLINNDGYWVRASDYSIYRDPKGKFHLIPHDMNESFNGGGGGPGGPGRGPGGPGGPGAGPGGRGPGGFGFMPPRPGELLPPPLRDALNLSDAQKKQFDDLQKEVDERVEKLLGDEQKTRWKNVRDNGPGAFGGPDGPGGFAFFALTPGNVLPVNIQEELNLTDGQKKQVTELQKDVDGKIEKILTGNQNEQFKAMREGGFGGPGGRGGDPFGRGRGGPPGGDQKGRGDKGGPPFGDQKGRGDKGGPPFGDQKGRGGPGGRGPGGRGGGYELDPFVASEDARKPLRSRLLAIPSLRVRYLDYVRTIAADALDWKTLGPVVAKYRALIEAEVEADTRKLYSLPAFKTAMSNEPPGGQGPQGGRGGMSLRAFADQRRNYLLNHPEIKKITPPARNPGRPD